MPVVLICVETNWSGSMVCRLCQNSEFYELELKCWYLRNWLVFMTIQLYTYWYLRVILVFTCDTGINARYWYLWMILVFTHHTGIYAWYWYLHVILVYTNDTGIYAWYWYLRMILVFIHDSGVYVRYWYLCTLLKLLHSNLNIVDKIKYHWSFYCTLVPTWVTIGEPCVSQHVTLIPSSLEHEILLLLRCGV